jgi:hypothetical protein
MRPDGICIPCTVDACSACDGREACDCRAAEHPHPSPDTARAAKLAARIVTLAQEITLHNSQVLRLTQALLIDAQYQRLGPARKDERAHVSRIADALSLELLSRALG